MKIWDLPTTEKDAIEFLQDRGLLHKTRGCRKGHPMKLYHTQRPVWECCKCSQQQGLRSGNWFSNTKQHATIWGVILPSSCGRK